MPSKADAPAEKSKLLRRQLASEKYNAAVCSAAFFCFQPCIFSLYSRSMSATVTVIDRVNPV